MFIVCSIVCITDQNLVGRLLKNEELDVCPILVWGLIVCPQTQEEIEPRTFKVLRYY